MEERREPAPDSVPVAALAPDQLAAQNSLLLTLFRVSAQLAAELGAPDFPAQAVQVIVGAVPNASIANLWLFDRGDKKLRLVASASAEGVPALDLAASDPIALRTDEGALGAALDQAQPIILPDGDAWARNLHHLDQINASRLVDLLAPLPALPAAVCLPLHLSTIPIGVLEINYLSHPMPFDAGLLSLLHAFADQLAVVVRNTQIYAEMSAQHRRLQAFDAVVTAITNASDIQHMLEQTLSVTLYVVGSQRGMTVVIEDALAHVSVSYDMPASITASAIEIDASPLVTVVRTAQPDAQIIAADHPWAALRDNNVVSVALLPLLARGAVVGVLIMAFESEAATALDWFSLLALGNQIGIALANYQLYSASQRERRQLAGVIASIAEGVLICDRHGQLVLSNDAATVMLGVELPSGMSIADLSRVLDMRADDQQPLALEATPLARSLQGNLYQNYEVNVTSGNGSDVIISCSGAPLFTDDTTIDGAVVVFRDVTAYRQHDALRDEFLTVAAHEMRSPLAAIKGYTDLLLQRETQRSSATDQDRRGVRLLARQIDHLVRLVDNLLDVSRLDAGSLALYVQPADLMNLVEASVDRIRISDVQHEFVLHGPPSLPIVCDQVRIQQVLTNLISNAARYSAAGTRITVDVWTEPCTIEGGTIVASGGSNLCAVVAVRDQGVGMSPEVQARVFEKYYRANTATAASGLGLGVYLSREIVQLHGGRIWLESTPGQGTNFYMMLPLHTADRQEQDVRAPSGVLGVDGR